MSIESYSVSQAARALGVSIPTVKRMAGDGEIQSFRTPGGHLRILAESLQSLRENKKTRTVREPSPVLANRRERVEELALQAQELRAKRDLTKLEAEEEAEARRRDEEADAEQRAIERETEAARLRRERLRLQEARERERRESERRLAAFRCNWLNKATESLPDWLSPAQRKEALAALETEIAKRQPDDEPIMPRLLAETATALIAPWQAEREAHQERERATRQALRALSVFATDAERARAAASVRKALENLPCNVEAFEIRAAAEDAVRPVRQAVEKRLLDERLIRWAIQELPWGRTDADEAYLRRQCMEILAELPSDVSEAEARDELEETVREASEEINERQARKRRAEQKASLIRQGVAEVSHYLWRLKQDGEISAKEYWDSGFSAALQRATREALEAEITGEETTKEVEELVHEIIDEELE
jgi:excisionase family DNA binding protein